LRSFALVDGPARPDDFVDESAGAVNAAG